MGHPVVVQIISMGISNYFRSKLNSLTRTKRNVYHGDEAEKGEKLPQAAMCTEILCTYSFIAGGEEKCLIILFYVQTLNKYYCSLLTHLQPAPALYTSDDNLFTPSNAGKLVMINRINIIT